MIFDEKHEFEKAEKMKLAKESTPASTAASELDFDSGYDRGTGVESRSSSKVWSKIHKQLNRRFGGSTGSLSSTSPNSELAAIKQPEPFTKTAEQLEGNRFLSASLISSSHLRTTCILKISNIVIFVNP